jgi:hypothetical protein
MEKWKPVAAEAGGRKVKVDILLLLNAPGRKQHSYSNHACVH